MVRAPINPTLAVNDIVQINQATIQRMEITPDIKSEITEDMMAATPGTRDGTYRILAIDWTGDTRGAEWFADLTCIGATGTAPPGQFALGRGGDTHVGTR